MSDMQSVRDTNILPLLMKTIKLAPIALFVFNRPNHTKQTVEALSLNKLANQTDLYVFSDGARNAKDERLVKKVRNYCKNIYGFKSVNLIERNRNWGLAKSIISGVTQIVNQYGKIIVVEEEGSKIVVEKK